MISNYQFIDFQGNLYVLKRKITKSSLKQDHDVGLLKRHFHCDTLLQRDNEYYFCNRVNDAEIIEE